MWSDIIPSKNALFLKANRIILGAGWGIVTVFLPVFLYTITDGNLPATLGALVAHFALHIILTPLAARVQHWVGTKQVLTLAIVPCLLGAMLLLVFWDEAPLIFLPLFIVLWSLYRALYWLPYHTDMSLFLTARHTGGQFSFLENISHVSMLLFPVIGGVVISIFGFSHAFLLASFFFLLSLVPLFFIADERPVFGLGYVRSFQELFQPTHRRLLYGFAAEGAHTVIGFAVWPIFVFSVLGGYVELGLLSAFVAVVTLGARFLVGMLVDGERSGRALVGAALIASSGWAVKAFASTPIHIAIADAYHAVGNAAHHTAIISTMYRRSAESGRCLDEYLTLVEMALSLGRVVMLVCAALLSFIVDIQTLFFIAAIAALGTATLRHIKPLAL